MKINDKVICVNDSPCQREEFFDFPNGHLLENKVYVVSGIIKSSVGATLGYLIVGYPVLCKRTRLDLGWHQERFVPLKRSPLTTV